MIGLFCDSLFIKTSKVSLVAVAVNAITRAFPGIMLRTCHNSFKMNQYSIIRNKTCKVSPDAFKLCEKLMAVIVDEAHLVKKWLISEQLATTLVTMPIV